MIPAIRSLTPKVRRSTAYALLLSGLCTAGATSAAEPDGAALVQQRRCYGCHHATQTLIGPSYTAIAARHAAARAVMETVLVRKIIDGGAGNWGVVPMVPNEQVSADEARVIARWILNQR
jgi:cytochrome c